MDGALLEMAEIAINEIEKWNVDKQWTTSKESSTEDSSLEKGEDMADMNLEPATLLSNTFRQTKRVYSQCFQKEVSLDFYSFLLKRILSFSKAMDEGSKECREPVWDQLQKISKLKMNPQDGNLFCPFLSSWLKCGKVSFTDLELIYISFVMATAGNDEQILPYLGENDSPFTAFGSSLPAVLTQMRLLKHWESKLDKLSGTQKKAIWNLCVIFPNFDSNTYTSFRKTFEAWNEDPIKYMNSISAFFGALGYLRETGSLRLDLCYPKTKIPVFGDIHDMDGESSEGDSYAQRQKLIELVLASSFSSSSSANATPLSSPQPSAPSSPLRRSTPPPSPLTNSPSSPQRSNPNNPFVFAPFPLLMKVVPPPQNSEVSMETPSYGLKRKFSNCVVNDLEQRRSKMHVSHLLC